MDKILHDLKNSEGLGFRIWGSVFGGFRLLGFRSGPFGLPGFNVDRSIASPLPLYQFD